MISELRRILSWRRSWLTSSIKACITDPFTWVLVVWHICHSLLQANDGIRRVSELQKEVTHLKQELHMGRLAAVQAADALSQLQVSAPGLLMLLSVWLCQSCTAQQGIVYI